MLEMGRRQGILLSLAEENVPSGHGPSDRSAIRGRISRPIKKFATKPAWMPHGNGIAFAKSGRLAGVQRANQPFYYAFVPGLYYRTLG